VDCPSASRCGTRRQQLFAPETGQGLRLAGSLRFRYRSTRSRRCPNKQMSSTNTSRGNANRLPAAKPGRTRERLMGGGQRPWVRRRRSGGSRRVRLQALFPGFEPFPRRRARPAAKRRLPNVPR